MSAKIIDGKRLSQEVRAACQARAARLTERGTQPGLAVVIVGDNPASMVYVRNKAKACSETGIYSEVHEFAESATAPPINMIFLPRSKRRHSEPETRTSLRYSSKRPVMLSSFRTAS